MFSDRLTLRMLVWRRCSIFFNMILLSVVFMDDIFFNYCYVFFSLHYTFLQSLQKPNSENNLYMNKRVPVTLSRFPLFQLLSPATLRAAQFGDHGSPISPLQGSTSQLFPSVIHPFDVCLRFLVQCVLFVVFITLSSGFLVTAHLVIKFHD